MDSKSAENAKDYSHIARRITVTLSAAQGLVSAAFVASGTISVVAAQLSGGPAWAGVASPVRQLGTALAALAVTAASDRIGRRSGLASGLGIGVLGAGLAVGSILAGSLPLFLGGALLLWEWLRQQCGWGASPPRRSIPRQAAARRSLAWSLGARWGLWQGRYLSGRQSDGRGGWA